MNIQQAIQVLIGTQIKGLKITQKEMVSDANVLTFASIIANNATINHHFLTKLTLDTLNITPDGLGLILLSLNAYKYQTDLHFSLCIKNMPMGEHLISALLPFLQNNQSIVELELVDNQLNCNNIITLVPALKMSANLRTVILDNNRISDEGADKLAGLLHDGSHIKTLSLNKNRISERGAEQLRLAIKDPQTSNVEWLLLDHNPDLSMNREVIYRCLESRRERIYRCEHNLKGKSKRVDERAEYFNVADEYLYDGCEQTPISG